MMKMVIFNFQWDVDSIKESKANRLQHQSMKRPHQLTKIVELVIGLAEEV